jgi:hypothetical protein
MRRSSYDFKDHVKLVGCLIREARGHLSLVLARREREARLSREEWFSVLVVVHMLFHHI